MADLTPHQQQIADSRVEELVSRLSWDPPALRAKATSYAKEAEVLEAGGEDGSAEKCRQIADRLAAAALDAEDPRVYCPECETLLDVRESELTAAEWERLPETHCPDCQQKRRVAGWKEGR